MKKLLQLFVLFQVISVQVFSHGSDICTDTSSYLATESKTDLIAFFSLYQDFLSQNVSGGKVNYKQIKNDKSILTELTKQIAEADVSTASKDTKTAFYVNAYNLLVISAVVNHFPINSPLAVKGFFNEKNYTIAGETLSLDELESKKLRQDARVHFVLVCAALGCPQISSNAYMPDKLQAQLDMQTKKVLNDNKFVQIDTNTKTVKLSKIFDWYKEDFQKSSSSVLNFINKYRTVKIPNDFRVEYDEYDWSLNSN